MDPKTRLDEKRNIPQPLQKLLALDVDLTKRFVSFSLNFVPIRSLKTHCKFLEVSSNEFSALSQIVTWKLICMIVFLFYFVTVLLSWTGMAGCFIGRVLVFRQSKLLSNTNESAHRSDIGHCVCGEH